MSSIYLPPQSGTSFLIQKGQFLKVLCIEDEQVADLVSFSTSDITEYLSNGKTFDYEETIRLTTGNILYSNRSNAMLEIVEDTSGVHDFLLAPCCLKTMEVFYGIVDKYPSCHENLYHALKSYGIGAANIPTAFNIFMNVPFDKNGKIKVLPPIAKKGDYIIFKCHMDMLIGLTACSASASNNGSFKPIAYNVLERSNNSE